MPGKIQEQIIKQSICNHLEEHKVLGSNQRDFCEVQIMPDQFNFICERMMSLAEEGKAILQLDFLFFFFLSSIPRHYQHQLSKRMPPKNSWVGMTLDEALKEVKRFCSRLTQLLIIVIIILLN